MISGHLTHELGHYSVARLLGYDAKINYKSTKIIDLNPVFRELAYEHQKKTFTSVDEEKKKKIHKDYILTFAGGPLITIIMGCTGFLIFMLHHAREKDILSIYSLLSISISLHWLRFPVNYLITLFYLLIGKITFCDETIIANYFDINEFWITTPLAIFGLIVLTCISYYLYKLRLFKIFISCLTLVGCISYGLWFYLLGPLVLP